MSYYSNPWKPREPLAQVKRREDRKDGDHPYQVAVKLTESQRLILHSLAEFEGKSMSEIVRQGIEAYIWRKSIEKPRQRFLDAHRAFRERRSREVPVRPSWWTGDLWSAELSAAEVIEGMGMDGE